MGWSKERAAPSPLRWVLSQGHPSFCVCVSNVLHLVFIRDQFSHPLRSIQLFGVIFWFDLIISNCNDLNLHNCVSLRFLLYTTATANMFCWLMVTPSLAALCSEAMSYQEVVVPDGGCTIQRPESCLWYVLGNALVKVSDKLWFWSHINKQVVSEVMSCVKLYHKTFSSCWSHEKWSFGCNI